MDSNKIMQAGSELVTSFGGPVAILGFLWRMLLWMVGLGLIAVVFILAIILAWKVWKSVSPIAAGLREFSLAGLVASVVKEVRGATAVTLDTFSQPLRTQGTSVSVTSVGEPLKELKDSVSLKNGIIEAAALVGGENNPALKIAKEAETELDAYKAAAKYLAGKRSVSET